MTPGRHQYTLFHVRAMPSIVDDAFNSWCAGRSPIEARISIFNNIRDIAYAGIPELVDPQRYVDILVLRRGSCTPKHLLMGNMYQRLGLSVLLAAYPFRWDQLDIDYPRTLRRLAEAMPTGHHLACRVDIDGRLVLVDATLDLPLQKLGLPVNDEWDGMRDTALPLPPCGEEQLYHPSEASLLRPQLDSATLAFYNELNLWLDRVRQSE